MRIAVIGDAMLDLTRFGTSERYSPEDVRCPILMEEHVEMRAGGAGNLACWLAVIPGAEVTLYTHLCRDRNGLALHDMLESRRVEVSEIGYRTCLAEPTTIKERVCLTQEGILLRQLVRIDRDTTMTLTEEEKRRLIDEFTRRRFEAIVVADYDKGFFRGLQGGDFREFLGRKLTDEEQPVIVNSKYPDQWQQYAWHSLIANREEANRAWDHVPSPLRLQRSKNLIITLGAQGVLMYHRPLAMNDWVQFQQDSLCTSPVDVTGAGDAFTAGYLYGVLCGPVLPVWLVHGSRWAAYCCQQVGVGFPNLEAIYGG